MKNIIDYILYYILVKSGIKQFKNYNINKTIKRKKTLESIVLLILRYPINIFLNFIKLINLNDLKTGNILFGNQKVFYKTIKNIRINQKPLKIIVLPSYCEKPKKCPVRFSPDCLGKVGKCNINCKFKEYPGFLNNELEYRFLTDDESVADLMIEGFHFNRKTGGRYILIMSICEFSHSLSKFFGIFGNIIIIKTFSNKVKHCSNLKQYFVGDAGLSMGENVIKKSENKDYFNYLNKLGTVVHFVHKE